MGAVTEMFESAGRAVVQGLNPRQNARNEIEATATKEAGERADQLGTKLGAGVAEAGAEVAVAVAGAASSKALGRALEAAGVGRPAGSAAHHLVAGGAAKAEEARRVLAKVGVGIDEAANGMFVVKRLHNTMHTNRYYEAVSRALQSASTRAEAVERLDIIRQAIARGAFP
jgi:hypothetical protein